MADVYFEISDVAVPKFGRKYFVMYDTSAAANTPLLSSANYLQCSERAWMEHEGSVWYIKNRFIHKAEVDLKEFMWVKLKAQTI